MAFLLLLFIYDSLKLMIISALGDIDEWIIHIVAIVHPGGIESTSSLASSTRMAKIPLYIPRPFKKTLPPVGLEP
jgi:hypothetical protein